MDQRDQAINTLSKYVDVHVTTDGSNQANIYTTTGIQLVGAGLASQFTFASAGALSATSLYNIDPAKSGVGALNIKLPNGSSVDVVANNVVVLGPDRGRSEAARPDAGAGAEPDRPARRDDVERAVGQDHGRQHGHRPAGRLRSRPCRCGSRAIRVNLTYTDTATNTQRQITLVNVTDPAALPLQNATNANPMRVGRELLRRHERDRLGAQHRALRLAPVVRRRSVAGDGHHAAGDRRQQRPRQGQFGLDHQDDLVADLGQPATAAVHRRRAGALHRRDHRHRARR